MSAIYIGQYYKVNIVSSGLKTRYDVADIYQNRVIFETIFLSICCSILSIGFWQSLWVHFHWYHGAFHTLCICLLVWALLWPALFCITFLCQEIDWCHQLIFHITSALEGTKLKDIVDVISFAGFIYAHLRIVLSSAFTQYLVVVFFGCFLTFYLLNQPSMYYIWLCFL